MANARHGTCDLGYYKAAIDYIAGHMQEAPVFYIFSADIAWVKHNLIPQYETVFVDISDDATNYEDLRLMSSCRHHIIANSSFSWWGAWLNSHPEKNHRRADKLVCGSRRAKPRYAPTILDHMLIAARLSVGYS